MQFSFPPTKKKNDLNKAFNENQSIATIYYF